MDITENERLQEVILQIGDALAPVSKVWWYILFTVFVLAIPGYFVIKTTFTAALVGTYGGPKMIYTAVTKEPLQIIDKKIFAYPGNNYSGYVKIKNINLEWGVASQEYKVEFKTFGGTTVNAVDRTTFILPASEKVIVLPKFQTDNKPDDIVITLADTHFIHKPDIQVDFDVQRTSVQNMPGGLVVSSAFVNKSPFTIGQVDLPVLVYNSQNQIVAVNFTYVNQVKSSEIRTFQYSWGSPVAGAIRAEVNPEVDIFDRNVLSVEPGVGEFNSSSQ